MPLAGTPRRPFFTTTGWSVPTIPIVNTSWR